MIDLRRAGSRRTEGVGRRSLARMAALALVSVALACSVDAQAQAKPVPAASAGQPVVETLTLKAYRMTHQPAREALPLIEPLLSAQGTVELRLGNNTLVVRDHPTVIRRLEPLLREFDHPPQQLPFQIHLLEARRAPAGGNAADNTRGLPPGLVESLGAMVQFNRYQLVAAIDLESKEGERVSYELGREYEVRFEVGTVLLDRRLKLHGFEILRPLGAGLDRQIFLANLNLTLGKTLVVAVADAGLAVAVTCAPASSVGEPRSVDGLGAP